MYRHYAKQRKLGKQQKQAVLSDEESSGDDDEDYTSGAQQAPVESGSDVSDDESGSDDDDDLLPPSQESGAEESAEEDELLPPPPGVPTAEEALDNSICAQPTDVDAQDAEEGPLICVVCPSKVLKRGKMLDVHLASKDHKRRIARFSAHVRSNEFDALDKGMDARLVAAQIDKLVLARLSAQTAHGGDSGKEKNSAAEAEAQAERERETENARVKALAIQEGISKRQALREAKMAKVKAKREAKKEKQARLRNRAKGKGEPVSDPKNPAKRPPKPTKEKIAERQAMKKAKREAEAAAAAAAGATEPKDEVQLKKEGKVKEPRSQATPDGKRKRAAKSKPNVDALVKEGPPIVHEQADAVGKEMPSKQKKKKRPSAATKA